MQAAARTAAQPCASSCPRRVTATRCRQGGAAPHCPAITARDCLQLCVCAGLCPPGLGLQTCGGVCFSEGREARKIPTMTTLGELGGLLGGGEGRENKKGERMQRSAPGVPTKKHPRVVLLAAPGDAGRALPSAALTETRGWGGSVRSAFPTPPRCGSGRAGCTLAASSLLSPATGKPARNTWVGNAQAAGGGMLQLLRPPAWRGGGGVCAIRNPADGWQTSCPPPRGLLALCDKKQRHQHGLRPRRWHLTTDGDVGSGWGFSFLLAAPLSGFLSGMRWGGF